MLLCDFLLWFCLENLILIGSDEYSVDDSVLSCLFLALKDLSWIFKSFKKQLKWDWHNLSKQTKQNGVTQSQT